MQARFWDYVNGSAVRIKLDVGQTIGHTEGGPTDEGYSYTRTDWTLDETGSYVIVETYCDARDCDGRLTSENRHTCRVRDLTAGNICDGVAYPKWQEAGYSQRDYSAEQMGY